MSTNANSLTARTSKVANKGQKIEFVAVERAPALDDFETMFAAASGTHKDFANIHVINVLPNFVPIVCYIMYHVSSTVHALEMSQHAKISAATYVAYCLACVYGHILICDSDVRQPPSHHSASYDQMQYKKDFLDYLRDLPVPKFMQPILDQLLPATDEMRPHVWFVPSPAGYSFEHYFGRLFPLSIFFNIHDCTAELPGNTPRHEVLADLLSRNLYTITSLNGSNTPFSASIGNYFTFGFEQNSNPSVHSSRLHQAFETLFNPVLFRDYQRRRTLASVSITAPTFPTEHHNAFDFLFGSRPNNCSEMRVIFDAISRAMKGTIPISGTLSDTFKNASGTKIMSHGYSEFGLPTHTRAKILTDSTKKSYTAIDPESFATHISFLQTKTDKLTTALEQPSADCATTPDHTVKVKFPSLPWFLISDRDAATKKPNPTTDYVRFDEKYHLYPKVQVLNVPDCSTVDAWKVTAFGMVIESFELDASVVPMPSIHIPNGLENSWFADSAVPLRYVYKLSDFGNSAKPLPPLLKRTSVYRANRFPAASHIANRTEIIVPAAAAKIVDSDVKSFPGLTLWESVTHIAKTIRFFGFCTADNRSHNSSSDEIAGIADNSLLVWSPYTYVGYADNEYDETSSLDYSKSKIYFLTNLRTIFGTRYPLVELKNALDAMPIN